MCSLSVHKNLTKWSSEFNEVTDPVPHPEVTGILTSNPAASPEVTGTFPSNPADRYGSAMLHVLQPSAAFAQHRLCGGPYCMEQ